MHSATTLALYSPPGNDLPTPYLASDVTLNHVEPANVKSNSVTLSYSTLAASYADIPATEWLFTSVSPSQVIESERLGDVENEFGHEIFALYLSATETSYLTTGKIPPSADNVLNSSGVGLPYTPAVSVKIEHLDDTLPVIGVLLADAAAIEHTILIAPNVSVCLNISYSCCSLLYCDRTID